MTPERWRQTESLYHAALELAPGQRAAFLDQACAGDEALRREVRSLLDSHDEAASFIEKSPDDVVAGMLAEEQAHSMIGRTLGHYRLNSLLGAGGMGEVYRAHDTRLDRDVAVKILPEHLAQNREALWRFEREAKAVATLSHPNILSIFDFGTEQGVSYAVTELLESDGITEAIINSLSQLPQLKRVIARSTMASYKGKEVDPRKVGQELNVRAVVTGRMTQRGDDLIIGAELVNAADGARLWGGQYSRKVAEVMEVQAEIARQISEKLRLNLTGEQQKRVTKHHTENSEAYQLYLKGRYHANRLSTDGLKKGIEYLNQAIAADPAYALAYAGLGDTYLDASGIYLPSGEAMLKARAAAQQALKRDESLAEAHTVLAYVKATYDWDWAGAEKEYRRTMELNPNYARAYHAYSVSLMEQGRADESIAALERARELDPLSLAVGSNLGYFYNLARRYDQAITLLRQILDQDPSLAVAHYTLGFAYQGKGMLTEAIAEFDQARRLDPENSYPLFYLGHAYAISGKVEEARQILKELAERSKQGYVEPVMTATIHAGLGEKDQAFALLEKAYQERSEELLFLKVSPKFDSLRSDPRFADLLRRLNLAP